MLGDEVVYVVVVFVGRRGRNKDIATLDILIVDTVLLPGWRGLSTLPNRGGWDLFITPSCICQLEHAVVAVPPSNLVGVSLTVARW